MDLTADSTSCLKRNLSFNDTLAGPVRHQRNGFTYHPAHQRRKQKMRTQRLVRQLKSVAVLGTALVCLVLFASSLLGEGGVGVSGRHGASEGANTAKARIQETLGLFGNGTSAFLSGEDDGTRFDRAQSPLKGLTHLVVVAGHSVLRYTDASRVEENESWYLEPYMEVPGQAATFVEHIRSGVEEAARDPRAILLFSGGTTKVKAGPMTEAQSYWTVAEKLDWFGHADVRHRAFTENFARDSFENLLFSLCRFAELTSEYPERMAVISYDFKRERFAGVHRRALRYPEARFRFLGSEYPAQNLERASEGERKVREKFESDPYGVHGELKQKLYARDPFVQGARYTNSCPEIQPLMRHSGREIFAGTLPWDKHHVERGGW